jgi:hypothetical protein
MNDRNFSSKKATFIAALATLPLFLGLIISQAVIAPKDKPVQTEAIEHKDEVTAVVLPQVVAAPIEVEPEELRSDVEMAPIDFAAKAQNAEQAQSEGVAGSSADATLSEQTISADIGTNAIAVEGEILAPQIKISIIPDDLQTIAKLTQLGFADVNLDTRQGRFSAKLAPSGQVITIDSTSGVNLSKRAVTLPNALVDDAIALFDKAVGPYKVNWVSLVFSNQLDHQLNQFTEKHPEVKVINIRLNGQVVEMEVAQ